MSAFDFDIDKQIKQYQQKIQELESQRQTHAKKIEGIQEFDAVIKRLCNQNNLSEEELYVSRSEQIENWILGMARQSNPSFIYQNLLKHFSKVSAKVGKEEKKSSLPKPKLPVGTYEHPFTHEKVEKIKRNPRLLDQWVEEHGFATVRTWKKD